jgi:hypothetical protein
MSCYIHGSRHRYRSLYLLGPDTDIVGIGIDPIPSGTDRLPSLYISSIQQIYYMIGPFFFGSDRLSSLPFLGNTTVGFWFFGTKRVNMPLGSDEYPRAIGLRIVKL